MNREKLRVYVNIFIAVAVPAALLLAFGMRKGQQAHLRALSKRGNGAAETEVRD